MPYVEVNGRMANLDVTPTFTAAVRCWPAATGPYTGAFPAGLLNNDVNNLGPRLGVAYRVNPDTVLRGGYSITYNSGPYASIARATRRPAAVRGNRNDHRHVRRDR